MMEKICEVFVIMSSEDKKEVKRREKLEKRIAKDQEKLKKAILGSMNRKSLKI